MIFNESNDRAVLHGDIHVEVFNGDVEFTDAFFIFLASDVQLVSRFLKQCDIFGILGDSRSIFGNVFFELLDLLSSFLIKIA